MMLDIVWEDEAILVVRKPSGLSRKAESRCPWIWLA